MTTKKIVDGIRAYLDGLGVSDKPVVDREAVKALRAQVKAETDPINKLKLITQLELEEQGHVPDRSGDEAVFIAEAKAYADSEGISATAFQSLGVPDDVLKQAGFDVTPAAAPKRASSGRSGGTRAPRIPIEEVEATAKKLGSGWKLGDLAEAIGREPATTRNYLNKLIEAGTITEIGDDPSHDGRGRAPKLYGAA